MLRLTLAALHLLALGIGLGAVLARGRALREPLDAGGFRRVFLADTLWGVAAVLWLVTGLWRLLAGTEKATDYYLAQPVFHAKMGLFVLLLALEAWPMLTLIRWRIALGRGVQPDMAPAPRLATLSYVEAAVVAAMVFVAVALAKGYGAA